VPARLGLGIRADFSLVLHLVEARRGRNRGARSALPMTAVQCGCAELGFVRGSAQERDRTSSSASACARVGVHGCSCANAETARVEHQCGYVHACDAWARTDAAAAVPRHEGSQAMNKEKRWLRVLIGVHRSTTRKTGEHGHRDVPWRGGVVVRGIDAAFRR
jgi:hypothetical protein